MNFWPGIPFVQAVAPFKVCAFLGFWECFGVWSDLGRGRGLIGQDWWYRVDVLRFFQRSPCFGPWLPLGPVHFEVLGSVLGSRGFLGRGGGLLGVEWW